MSRGGRQDTGPCPGESALLSTETPGPVAQSRYPHPSSQPSWGIPAPGNIFEKFCPGLAGDPGSRLDGGEGQASGQHVQWIKSTGFMVQQAWI